MKGRRVDDFVDVTLPALLFDRAKSSESEIAFRFKEFGIYKGVTWGDYRENVENFASGLIELGLKPGDTVAVMGEPCPEWCYADLGTLSAGGIVFGVYTTSSVEELGYVMEVGEAKFFVAEDQEYVDKIMLVIDRLPKLSKIIVIDTSTMFMYQDSRIISFTDTQELGRKRKEKYPQELSQCISNLDPHGPAIIIFTSGTSGPPKPSVLSHHSIILGFALPHAEIIPDIWGTQYRTVAHLSMAHIAERGASVYYPLIFNWIAHIGESPQYLQETLFEVQPTLVTAVPRIYEKIAAQAVTSIESSSWIKKLSYRWAMSWGRAYMELKWKGEKIPLVRRLLRLAARQICFRHILHRLGFSKIKLVYSVGAPLPAPTQMMWQIWGVDMITVYGSTEASMVSAQRPGFPMPGNIGKPNAINKVALAEDGEITVSGPGVFIGYWKDEKATREVKKEGWVYTGDVGEWTEEGNLRLIDRKKDIMITSGGKNITPSLIETTLKGSPYISEAVLIADGRKFPSALIEIDFDTVSEWARRNKV
ncbi:MAG: AMP-binding protein, partial [Candidatus Zixiibacteriota bacterium]